MTQSASVHYLQILVRDGGVSDWERSFCASLIAQQRTGKPMSAKQAKVLDRIAEDFRRRSLTQDGGVIE